MGGIIEATSIYPASFLVRAKYVHLTAFNNHKNQAVWTRHFQTPSSPQPCEEDSNVTMTETKKQDTSGLIAELEFESDLQFINLSLSPLVLSAVLQINSGLCNAIPELSEQHPWPLLLLRHNP